MDSVPVSQPVFPPTPVEVSKEEEDEPTDGTKFGQYVLLDRIATGGMAEVWKARMRGVEGFQKTVAIKKILPHLSDNQDFIEMFIDEAKLAAQLSHNNIIHIYDLGKIQSSYYIAMEYVDGSDLKTILRKAQERDQPMAVELALFVATKVASALDYAHRKRDFQDREMGLVHRDVSPQNVLISEEGDIKLCDFGIAKAASKASHTQAGALKGKLQYMSPEQAWGRSIDRRSDIFALAVVLYEMLAGRKLFAGDNELSILDQVRDGKVSMPSEINDEVTPEIDNVMRKALAKDPADRYQTAGELARDLDAILYSFKPTPTSADLAIYMHRLSVPVAPMNPEPAHVHHEPEPEVIAPVVIPKAVPVAAPVAAAPAPAANTMPTWDSSPNVAVSPMFAETPEKKTPVIPIAIAAAVLLAAVGGFFFFKSGSSTPAAATPAKVAGTASTAPVTDTTATALTDSSGTAVPLGTVAPVSGTLDPKLIDQEVQKRMAAERLKLEQQNAKLAPTTATTAPAAAAAVPRPVPTATQAPVTATQAEAAPERPAPTPTPQVAETPRPAPEPEVVRAREGDLVPQGTEGLAPPRILKRATVQYPPMARVQKVEGTIICSVLVNEKGQVSDVKILRGSNRGAGLNEAAEQMMRRSTFSPGVKDGVKVKSWTTVPVDFKL
jgi:eukaryotic-like serine/threonine-protein kinase